MFKVELKITGKLLAVKAARAVWRKVVGKVLSMTESNSLATHPTPVTTPGSLCKKVEQHYKTPQDIEWALDGDLPDGENLTLLQSRPETVWSQKPKTKKTGTYQFGMEGLLGSLLNPLNKKKESK